MRHVFIINPVSGKKNVAFSMHSQIDEAAKSLGIVPEIEVTNAPKHATHLAAEAAKKGDAVRLYAVGGDGTLNEVFYGAYPFANAEVACVPCGSGNDFIRYFGQASDFLNIPAQMAGSAVAVDLIKVDGGISVAITSAGLDAEVAHGIPKYRRIPLLGGSMAYNISIAERLLRPLGKQLSITIDGNTFEGKYLICAVCNASHYGGGYNAAPMAQIDDGILNVILVKKVSRLLIPEIIGKYKNGKHYQNGAIIPSLSAMIQHIKARNVEVHAVNGEPFVLNIDGETGPAPRLTAQIMPQAARFVLPAHLAKPAHGTKKIAQEQ